MRITHLLRAGLALTALPAVFSSHLTAFSQTRVFACEADMGTALSEMEKTYGEHAFSTAENEHQSFTVFTVDPQDRSWSMLITMPNGQVCMVHFGVNWQPVYIEPGAPS